MSGALKVVNLGLPKSGTTTLAKALRKAGFSVADYRIRGGQSTNPAIHKRYVGGLMYQGYFETGDPLNMLTEFDAFTEINLLKPGRSFWPQTDWGIIDAIRRNYPGVRFLASKRDARDQAMSMLRWSDMGMQRMPKLNIPGLPTGYGETTLQRVQWIEAHHSFLRKVFEDDQNFLEFDIADPAAPEHLGAFLDRDFPWWGKANSNEKVA